MQPSISKTLFIIIIIIIITILPLSTANNLFYSDLQFGCIFEYFM
jgi:hypothetical protein